MKFVSRKFIFASLSIIAVFCLFGQVKKTASKPIRPKKTTIVRWEHADVLSFDQAVNPDVQVLRGNVVFRHDSAYMYCDSAYFYEKTNSLEAFNNVRMEQGDTLFVYGDHLYYDGNTQIAYLRNNVRMENGQVTLFTDSLNYERIPNIGYFFEGGMIVDSLNQLSSFYGQYSPETKDATFNDSVRLENPKFTLYSDTLLYNTNSKIATITGPSTIVSDSGTIQSAHGWYNTEKNTALLLDRSRVDSKSKTRSLIGDSIYYDRDKGYGEAFGNIFITDTVQHIDLRGDYGYYNDKDESAFATKNAFVQQYSASGGDTLFLHGDTLQMITIDSTYRKVKAFYGVRFYRADIQGVCDSMLYDTKDSLLHMYKNPVLWNENYQLYGDTISIHMNDSTPDFAHVKQFAMACQQVDSTSSFYDQLSGKDLKAYFEGKEIRQIDVEGNAESIFYPQEKDSSIVGLNATKSGFLTIWIKDRKLDHLKIWPTPEGSMTPIPDLKPEQKTLKNFFWLDYLRPLNQKDIFRAVKRKEAQVPKRSNKFIP